MVMPFTDLCISSNYFSNIVALTGKGCRDFSHETNGSSYFGGEKLAAKFHIP